MWHTCLHYLGIEYNDLDLQMNLYMELDQTLPMPVILVTLIQVPRQCLLQDKCSESLSLPHK